MPDGTSTLLGAVADGAKWLWIGLLSLLVWNGKRMVNRVDDLEKNSVRIDSFDKAVNRLLNDIDNKHKETREDIKGVHDRIDGLK